MAELGDLSRGDKSGRALPRRREQSHLNLITEVLAAAASSEQLKGEERQNGEYAKLSIFVHVRFRDAAYIEVVVTRMMARRRVLRLVISCQVVRG